MTLVAFLIYALCVYRLAVLVVDDTITDPMRKWVKRSQKGHRTAQHPKLAKLVDCYFCTSFWAAIPVVVLAKYCSSWFLWVAAVFAFSAVAGFLAERE